MAVLYDWLAVWLFLAAGGGYLVRRVIEDSSASERIERKIKLVALKRDMDEAHVSVDELSDFEDGISGRKARIRVAEDAAAEQLHATEEDNLGETQTEMNARMAYRANHAARELASVEEEFSELLNVAENELFQEASDHWHRFVQKQADMTATFFAGGSMAPLASSAELSA